MRVNPAGSRFVPKEKHLLPNFVTTESYMETMFGVWVNFSLRWENERHWGKWTLSTSAWEKTSNHIGEYSNHISTFIDFTAFIYPCSTTLFCLLIRLAFTSPFALQLAVFSILTLLSKNLHCFSNLPLCVDLILPYQPHVLVALLDLWPLRRVHPTYFRWCLQIWLLLLLLE